MDVNVNCWTGELFVDDTINYLPSINPDKR